MSTLFGELQGNDAYEILGVRPDASADEIRRAWRKQASAHHPDRVTDPEAKAAAEDRLRLINAARDVLTTRRAAYDGARRGPAADRPEADGPGVHDPWEEAEEVAEDPWDTAAPGTPATGAPNDPWAGAYAGRRPPPPPYPPPPYPPPPGFAPPPNFDDPYSPQPPNVPHPPPPPRAARSKLGPDSRFALGCAGLAATFWFGVLAVGVYGAFLSPDDAPDPPPPIPADLAGTWTGKITEKGEKEGGWKAKFVLRKGEQGGKATYRDGKCTGSFVTVSYREGILTLDTTFPADKPDCDGGDVRLSLRDDGRLDAVYPPAGERKVEAAGKLRRK